MGYGGKARGVGLYVYGVHSIYGQFLKEDRNSNLAFWIASLYY
jgi:hypothetical protein